MKRWGLWCVMTCVYGFSYAQISLSGQVSNSSGQSLPQVQVVVFDTLMRIRHYTGTDSAGVFYLTLPPGHYYVSFRKMDYQSMDTLVYLRQSSNWQIILGHDKYNVEQLQQIVFEIPDHTTRRLTDTIYFKTDSIRDGTEKNMGELLDKLPGLEVRNGRLYAYGNPVTELLIEGKNVFGRNQKIPLSELPAEMIKSVEYYENYNDPLNPASEGFFSGKSAVNVLLKKNYINRWTGRLEAGLGYPSKRATQNHLFRFGSGANLFLMLHYNNIQKQVLDIQDLYTLTGTLPLSATDWITQNEKGTTESMRLLPAIHYFYENPGKYRFKSYGIYYGLSDITRRTKYRYYYTDTVPLIWKADHLRRGGSALGGWQYTFKTHRNATWLWEGYLMKSIYHQKGNEFWNNKPWNTDGQLHNVSGRIETRYSLRKGKWLWEWKGLWEGGTDNHNVLFDNADNRLLSLSAIQKNIWEGGLSVKRRMSLRLFLFGKTRFRIEDKRNSYSCAGIYDMDNEYINKKRIWSTQMGGLYFRGRWILDASLTTWYVSMNDNFRMKRDYFMGLPSLRLTYRTSVWHLLYQWSHEASIAGDTYFVPFGIMNNPYELFTGNSSLENVSKKNYHRLRMAYLKPSSLWDELTWEMKYADTYLPAMWAVTGDTTMMRYKAVGGGWQSSDEIMFRWRKKIKRWQGDYRFIYTNNHTRQISGDTSELKYIQGLGYARRHRLKISYLHDKFKSIVSFHYGVLNYKTNMFSGKYYRYGWKWKLIYMGNTWGMEVLWDHKYLQYSSMIYMINIPSMSVYYRLNDKWFFVQWQNMLHFYPGMEMSTQYFDSYYEVETFPVFKGYILAGMRWKL